MSCSKSLCARANSHVQHWTSPNSVLLKAGPLRSIHTEVQLKNEAEINFPAWPLAEKSLLAEPQIAAPQRKDEQGQVPSYKVMISWSCLTNYTQRNAQKVRSFPSAAFSSKASSPSCGCVPWVCTFFSLTSAICLHVKGLTCLFFGQY